MRPLLFLYNPTAGKGHISQRLHGIVERLTRAGWLVSAYPTQGKGDAARMVRARGAQFERVICAGGDGTLSQTVAGVMELASEQRPVIGFIPAGSTNDCAHNFNLPTGLLAAASVAGKDGVPKALDVGRLNDTPFIYVAAFGAFTEVAYDTPQELKNTFGHMAYIMAGIGQLPNLTPYRLKVEYDGKVIEDDFLYGMVCNTYSIGGFKGPVLPADRVVLDDGLFEVVLVRKDIKIGDLSSVLSSLVRNAPVDTAAVVSFETSRLTITSDTPIPWTLDGEYGGTYAVSQVTNCHRAVTVVQGKTEK